ncbi:MAG: hypothetical protein JXC36_06480 [Candidatus Atribacteria bacterium]|nr:hypothetical protein [Candidatus Atribacteria bacterium]
MRDKRFVAVHRGGFLAKEQHQKLIEWAKKCSEHVLPLMGKNIDSRLMTALDVAQKWKEGRATVGEARKAAINVHALARESSEPVVKAIARSVGHAVATAHMADHSVGAALYARRAVKHSGKSVEAERHWQMMQLPSEIKEITLILMENKEKHFKI